MYSAKEEERGAENEKPAVNAFSPQRGDEMKRHAKAVLDKWGFRGVGRIHRHIDLVCE
jgi:hypothetical protein